MGKGNKFKPLPQLIESPKPPGLGVKGTISKPDAGKREEQRHGKRKSEPNGVSHAAARLSQQPPPQQQKQQQQGEQQLQQKQAAADRLKPPLTSNQRRKARRKKLQAAADTQRAAPEAAKLPQPAQPAERPSQLMRDAGGADRPKKRAKKQHGAFTPAIAAGSERMPAASSPAADGADATPSTAAAEGKQPAAAQKAAKRPAQAKQPLPTVVDAPKPGAVGNSNWAALKAVIGGGKRRVLEADLKGSSPEGAVAAARPQPRGPSTSPTPVLAVDCEMVGVGPDGARSSLARVCVINAHGNVLLDACVRQKERVTDFRTRFSGIRPADVAPENAKPFEEVQAAAAALFKDRILVGHAIHNDLKALLLSHPRKLIRDTARFPPLMRATAPGRKPRPRALRHLAFELLGLGIQEGEHSPVEDARAALYLYQHFAAEWERRERAGTVKQLAAPLQLGKGHKPVAAGRSLAELAAKDVMVDL